MKKWTKLLTIGVLGAVLLSGCNSNDNSDKSLSKVEQDKTLTVATSGTLYPSSYYNDKNELVGYDVDIAKEVAHRLGVKIQFKEYNVDGQIASLTKGEADFAANDFGINADREKKFSLSSPIKYSFDSMIVRKSDNSGIASLEDLAGKKAAGEPNTSYMKLAEEYANGRTDVILNDYYLQKMALAALPNVPVKILEDVYFNPNETGFLFMKEHNALREKVNTVLEDMKKDGTFKKISEQYFQTDISVKSDKPVQTVETKN
jgi:cystine transport system substrate-binding protein